jgi:pyridinium-3,5-biscarboxylic acid mononucleotide synthase
MTGNRNLSKFHRGLPIQRKNRMLAIQDVKDFAKLDIGRQPRKGLPEIILAEGKPPEKVAAIAKAMVERTGRALISRANANHLRAIRSAKIDNHVMEYFEDAGIIIVKSKARTIPKTGGRVGILTAGTSDLPVAEEASIISHEMGCETRVYNDVGVAGIHRLFKPLKTLLRWNADVILVVAGREGALPTVVAGMVDLPVIGVPTSRSYGFGGNGVATLAAMLQSCSLGMAVVNIDGGVGAGAIGALIANRAAIGRNTRSRSKENRK